MTDPIDEYEPTTRRRRSVRVIAVVLVALLALPIVVQAIRIVAGLLGS